MEMSYTDNKLALKLLINKKSNKVLFGEASKDIVDFIFSLFALPLGAVTKLLTKDAMFGSIGEVYHSLSKLNATYILSDGEVSSLLNPTLASTSNTTTNFLLPSTTHQDTREIVFYICSSRQSHGNSCPYVAEVKGLTCPRCGTRMDTEAEYVDAKSGRSAAEGGGEGKGYVKGVLTYSVMDDLTVVPMSTISSITLLNKFNIKDLGSLEEKTVTVGFEEVRY